MIQGIGWSGGWQGPQVGLVSGITHGHVWCQAGHSAFSVLTDGKGESLPPGSL